MDIKELRKKYPQYNDMSDIELADRFHAKFYSDMPKDTFYSKLGIVSSENKTGQTAPSPEPKMRINWNPLSWGSTPFQGIETGGGMGEVTKERLPEMAGIAASAVYPSPVTFPTVYSLGNQLLRYAQEKQGEAQPADNLGERVSGFRKDLQDAALWELGMRGALGAASRIGRKPSKMTPDQRRVSELVEERGVGPSPSAYSPRKGLAGTLETVSETFPTGRLAADMNRKKLVNTLNQWGDEIVEDVTGLPKEQISKDDIGRSMIQEVERMQKEAGVRVKAAYERFEGFFKSPKEAISAPSLQAALEDIASKNKGSALGEWAENRSKEFADGMITAHDLNQLQSSIWENTWPKNRREGAKLWNSLIADMGTARPEVAQALLEAKELRRLMKMLKDDPAIRSIMGSQRLDRPDLVIRKVFTPGNTETVSRLRKRMDPEAWETARSGYADYLVGTAMDTTKGGAGEALFLPAKFVKTYELHEKQIRNVFPESFDKFRDLYLFSKASISDVAQTGMEAQMKGWAKASALPGLLGLAKGALGGSFAEAIAIPIAGSWILARSLQKPRGLARSLLTKGLPMQRFPKKPSLALGQYEYAQGKDEQ